MIGVLAVDLILYSLVSVEYLEGTTLGHTRVNGFLVWAWDSLVHSLVVGESRSGVSMCEATLVGYIPLRLHCSGVVCEAPHLH